MTLTHRTDPARAGRTRPILLAAALATLAAAPAPARAQVRDWGEGDFYTFATDADGWSVVEPGQTHRKVYVSATGLSTNSGLTPDSPVNITRGLSLVRAGSSDWLLFKRGDDFGDGDIRLRNQFAGASAMNPIVIGAYGTGERPRLGGSLNLWDTATNLVVRDLHFDRTPGQADNNAVDILGNVSNVLIENVRADRESRMHTNNNSVIHHVTLRRNVFLDAYRDAPTGDTAADRVSGFYIASSSHVLLEQNVFDHNGWEDGYTTDKEDPRYYQTQEPSMFSHNLYVGPGMHDMTVRDNVTARGASMGFKLVSPGVIEGNVLVANNLALGINDGEQGEADTGGGDFLVLRDNVSLHGAGKPGSNIGARGWGLTMGEDDTADNGVIERNVEAHASNINGGNTLATQNFAAARRFVDNVVHNWEDQPNLDPDPSAPYPAPSRTIMTYMASLGAPGTLDAFYAAVRAQRQGNWDEDFSARAIVRYVQEGFGVYPGGRTAPADVTFASDGTDGVRWDNRANWSTNDRPMPGDDVDLDGHTVNFASVVAVNGLDLGGGTLRVRGGRLDVTGAGGFAGNGGQVEVARSGQFFVNGHSGAAHVGIHVTAGRFRNTGLLGGTYTLAISGGSAELIGGGADVEVRGGSRILVLGDAARVGGYAAGPGQVRLYSGGRLDFVFDADGVSTLGALAGSPAGLTVHADADGLAAATLGIDVADLTLPTGLHTFHLIDVDALGGEFGHFDVAGLGQHGINGLRLVWDQARGDAILTVAVNDPRINGFAYEAVLVPEPAATLGLAGVAAWLAGRRRARAR